MSWLDHQEQHQNAKTLDEENKSTKIEIHMPGAPDGVYVPLGASQIKRKYSDSTGPLLLCIVDEVAELLQPSKVKTEQGKAEDALRAEIQMILGSLAQLARSAGIHLILCTQRNDACIAVEQPLRVIRGDSAIDILWRDVKVGDVFPEDGSAVVNIGKSHIDCCYSFNGDMMVSCDHLFQVNVFDGELNVNDLLSLDYIKSMMLRSEKGLDNSWWCAEDLFSIVKNYRVEKPDGDVIYSIELCEEEHEVFCIQTNTGFYKINGYVNKNSVIPGMLQNNSLSLDTKVIVRREKHIS